MSQDSSTSADMSGVANPQESTAKLNTLATDLAAKKEAIKNYLEANAEIFENVKTLRADLSGIREAIIEEMTSAEVESFEASNGLKFKNIVKAHCKFTAKDLSETIGSDAVDTYKRKFVENKRVLTVNLTVNKKNKN